LTFEGHNILSVLLTFRTFTAELSRIAAVFTPGDPMRAFLSSFRIGSSHRDVMNPLASTHYPHKSASMQGMSFRRFGQLFAFATALRFARPPTDLDQRWTVSHPTYKGFYFPAYNRRRIAPLPAGYDYGAKLRIAPAGLSPASSAASLAAP